MARDLAVATRIIRETDVSFPVGQRASAGAQERAAARRAKVEELAFSISKGMYQPPCEEIASILAPALRSAIGATDEEGANR
jgi:ABC-type cobalt transport system substrate-binding protein